MSVSEKCAGIALRASNQVDETNSVRQHIDWAGAPHLDFKHGRTNDRPVAGATLHPKV